MPYIIKQCITTYAPSASGQPGATQRRTSTKRHAVATLDEAREAVASEYRIEFPDGRTARDLITEQGGTVGPLPDGTTIEVEPTTYVNLANAAAMPAARRAYVTSPGYGSGEPYAAEIITAYNERHAQ
jgi:hypothetical protein